MSYVLAIDVGTSFTAAAIAPIDQSAPRVPETLPLGLRGTAVPSVVYYPEEGPLLIGEAAERRGLDFPERVVREFKRRVGDEVPISVGTLQLPAEGVFATMARWVAGRAEEREGAPPSDIILTHPASWGAHRKQLVLSALSTQGLANVTLISEPEAAALHYAAQVRVEGGSTIAVYDLGGGTFDTAVLRKADAGHFDLLGRPEGIEGLGGADFDAAVLRHVFAHAEQALAGLDLSAPGVSAALARLRRECVEAKEALSSDSEASISVLLPGIQQQVRLVRSEFEDMICEPIRETVDALGHSLQDLGLEAEDLSAVLLIGGSSRIPLVAQLISELLDRPIAVDVDPKSSICLGAALAARRAHQAAAAAAAAAALTAARGAAAEPSKAEADAAQEAGAGAHVGNRRASWSRKSGAAFGVPAGAAAAASATAASGAHGGRRGQRSTLRLTAVAASAALFTVLTATAAQSPEGLGSLTAVFVPQGDGASSDPASAGTGSDVAAQGGAAAGGAAGSVGGVQAPAKGIEATAKKASGQPASGAGFEAAAPASQPSALAKAPASAEGATSGGTTAASTADGTAGATTDPTQADGWSLAGTPTTSPDPTTDPTTEPVPEPTSDPPPPGPGPAPALAPEPEPTTDPPAPEPTADPLAQPEPTADPPAPEPEPTSTETSAPIVTEPAG